MKHTLDTILDSYIQGEIESDRKLQIPKTTREVQSNFVNEAFKSGNKKIIMWAIEIVLNDKFIFYPDGLDVKETMEIIQTKYPNSKLVSNEYIVILRNQ